MVNSRRRTAWLSVRCAVAWRDILGVAPGALFLGVIVGKWLEAHLPASPVGSRRRKVVIECGDKIAWTISLVYNLPMMFLSCVLFADFVGVGLE